MRDLPRHTSCAAHRSGKRTRALAPPMLLLACLFMAALPAPPLFANPSRLSAPQAACALGDAPIANLAAQGVIGSVPSDDDERRIRDHLLSLCNDGETFSFGFDTHSAPAEYLPILLATARAMCGPDAAPQWWPVPRPAGRRGIPLTAYQYSLVCEIRHIDKLAQPIKVEPSRGGLRPLLGKRTLWPVCTTRCRSVTGSSGEPLAPVSWVQDPPSRKHVVCPAHLGLDPGPHGYLPRCDAAA